MANTTINDLSRLVQSTEDFGNDLAKIDDYAAGAIAERQQIPETKDSLKDAIYAVERETTPRILQISGRLVQMIEDNNFNVNFPVHLDKRYREERINAKLEAEILYITADSEFWPKHRIGHRICRLKINPCKEKISINYEEDKRTPKDYCSDKQKIKIINRLSRFSKKPKDAFRIIAERYADETRSEYLQAFLVLYANMPKIISEAAKSFESYEAQRKQTLEIEQESIRQLAEGTQ